MGIKLILLDMDGTLLGRSQVAVSVRNMEALQRVLRRGVTVVPCTGRVYDMMPPQILTQEGIRYFITCHGAKVYDSQASLDLYGDVISPEGSARILELIEGRGLYCEIAAEKTIYFEKAIADDFTSQPVPEHHVWYIRDKCYRAVEKPSAYFLEHGIGIEKINLYGIPVSIQEPLFQELMSAGLIRFTQPTPGPNLEFSHRTLQKMAAVDAVLRLTGIPYDEVMSLGDSGSDLDMLRQCGLGIAMGNAPESIKSAARDVTLANTEDGVAAALQKYILSPEGLCSR